MVGETERGELADQLSIHTRLLEVEAGQIAMNGEARRAHLPTDRAHGPISTLGIAQLLDQPTRAVDANVVARGAELAPGAGHPIELQGFEFGSDLTHDRPPCRLACHSARYRRSGLA